MMTEEEYESRMLELVHCTKRNRKEHIAMIINSEFEPSNQMWADSKILTKDMLELICKSGSNIGTVKCALYLVHDTLRSHVPRPRPEDRTGHRRRCHA
jgi:hypothetical protein